MSSRAPLHPRKVRDQCSQDVALFPGRSPRRPSQTAPPARQVRDRRSYASSSAHVPSRGQRAVRYARCVRPSPSPPKIKINTRVTPLAFGQQGMANVALNATASASRRRPPEGAPRSGEQLGTSPARCTPRRRRTSHRAGCNLRATRTSPPKHGYPAPQRLPARRRTRPGS